jgi:hypothetical protein
MRVIIGLIKGLVIGGAAGYGLLRLGWTGAALTYVACAVVGAVVGVVAGRAPWKAETIWTPVLKMIVGALVGLGLAALGVRFGPDIQVFVKPLHTGLDMVPFRSGPILAPIIGVLYGIFVEWDDGASKKSAPRAADPPAKKPRA